MAGPKATGFGHIFRYIVEGKRCLEITSNPMSLAGIAISVLVELTIVVTTGSFLLRAEHFAASGERDRANLAPTLPL